MDLIKQHRIKPEPLPPGCWRDCNGFGEDDKYGDPDELRRMLVAAHVIKPDSNNC